MPDALSPATVAVTAGRPAPTPDAPLNEPVMLASTYRAGGPVGYSRYGNPNWAAFETVLGALEGGQAICFASGMAAVAAVVGLVPTGGVLVMPPAAYSGTLRLAGDLAEQGRLVVRHATPADPPGWAAACEGANLVWLETPSNPLLEVVDIAAAAHTAHAAGALVAVDNTFATPLGQLPLSLGADVVVHSASKYLAGHSDLVLGAVVTADDTLVARLTDARAFGGAVPGPVEAWLALRGLRTLPLRLERAQHNAGVLAVRLQEHPAVSTVRYPGLASDPGHDLASRQMRGYGAVVAATIGDDDGQLADETIARLRLWVPATSLGGVESTIERRRRWAGESPRVPAALVRLSVGVEDVEDLWADLAGALDEVSSAARHG